MSVSESTSGKAHQSQVPMVQVKSIKVKPPGEYFEERKDLDGFLLQCDLYIWHNQVQFQTENESMFTATYLWGDAFDWVQAHLKDFLENSQAKCEDITNEIFDQFSGFKKHIQELFGDIDAERTVEWMLMNLQQWGSAAVYAAEFQRIAFKTGWGDISLTAQFYRGLKDGVKDNIMKAEWPGTLQAMIKLAVQIDNWQHEQRMERTKLHALVIVTQRKPAMIYHNPYGLQPMDLDATHGHSGWSKGTGRFQKKGTPSHFKKRECYNCGISGHFTQECRKQKKSQSITTTKQGPGGTKQQVLAIMEERNPGLAALGQESMEAKQRHNSMSWTACYDDTCQTHRSDKDGSRWYPEPPRKDLHRTQVKGHVDSPYPKSNSEKGYEVIKLSSTEKEPLWDQPGYAQHRNHYSSNSSQEDFSQKELQEVRDMIKKVNGQVAVKMSEPGQEYPAELWKSAYVSVFNVLETSPKLVSYREGILQIQRQMTPLTTEAQAAASFKKVYEECYGIFKEQVAQPGSPFVKRVQWMRDQLDMIVGQEGREYSNIVREYPPIGSRFTKNGGYVTPKNSFISWAMWMKVWAIQQEYHRLDPRKNPTSLVDPMKFDYLEPIGPKAKN